MHTKIRTVKQIESVVPSGIDAELRQKESEYVTGAVE